MIPDKIIDISDTGLINKLRESDQFAFSEIYKRYWSRLFSYAYNILKDKSVCEDIIQEVFSDLWFRRKDVEIENASAFLFQSVKYQILKYIRKNKIIRKHLLRLESVILEESLATKIDYNDFSKQIKKLVEQLPEKRKEIFYLSRFENLSNQEISDKLQISLQTVKNQISESLKFLQKSRKTLFLLILYFFQKAF